MGGSIAERSAARHRAASHAFENRDGLHVRRVREHVDGDTPSTPSYAHVPRRVASSARSRESASGSHDTYTTRSGAVGPGSRRSTAGEVPVRGGSSTTTSKGGRLFLSRAMRVLDLAAHEPTSAARPRSPSRSPRRPRRRLGSLRWPTTSCPRKAAGWRRAPGPHTGRARGRVRAARRRGRVRARRPRRRGWSGRTTSPTPGTSPPPLVPRSGSCPASLDGLGPEQHGARMRMNVQ